MCGSRLELVHVINLAVHALQRSGEHLLAPEGVLGCARKLAPLCVPFPRTARRFRGPGTRLIAHLTQTLAQLPEFVKRRVIDFGMVTAQDDLMLVKLRMLRSNLQGMDIANLDYTAAASFRAVARK